MRSYSIAILCHNNASDPHLLESIAQFRQQMPFASVYWYGNGLEEGKKLALQKQDVTIRHDDSKSTFQTVRRMFTEVDADVFVYVGSPHYPAELASSMIHHLIETRKDMVAAINPKANGKLERDYRTLCNGLYGRELDSPLSDYRVFSRRFVKSFAAFERGLPIELEWSMHALELDIPYLEVPIDDAHQEMLKVPEVSQPSAKRHMLTRLIINLQARPLKWFGMITTFFFMMMALFKISMLSHYAGWGEIFPVDLSLAGAISYGILMIITAISGIMVHSQSHQRRELKRLHFQQHSTL